MSLNTSRQVQILLSDQCQNRDYQLNFQGCHVNVCKLVGQQCSSSTVAAAMTGT